MNNYEEGTRRGNYNNRRGYNNNRNNNSGYKKRNYNNYNNNNNSAANTSDYMAKKAEIIAKQKINLGMIDKVSAYLDKVVATATADTKIAMKQIIEYLDTCGFTKDDTKVISQYNYLLMDLANAQICDYIKGNKINIRILYIQERLKSSYKKELNTAIDTLLGTYTHLFNWNESTGDDSIEFTPITAEEAENTANDLVKEDVESENTKEE